LSLFELRMLPRHAQESFRIPSVANIERLAGAAFVVTTDAISPFAGTGSTARLADWVEAAADDVSKGGSVPPSPEPVANAPAIALASDARIGRRAVELLEREVQHVASAAH
jgi:hypothetical protein